jgi:hypothetical protein
MIFFGRHRTFTSLLISLATLSKKVHIGVVLEMADSFGTNNLFLLESGRTFHDGLKDELTNIRVVSGVRLVDLKLRLSLSDTEVYVRKATEKIRNTVSHDNFAPRFCSKMKGKPYEKSFVALLNSAWNFKKAPRDLSSIFCSELVAEFLIAMRELEYTKTSSCYSPGRLAKMPLKHYHEIERIA